MSTHEQAGAVLLELLFGLRGSEFPIATRLRLMQLLSPHTSRTDAYRLTNELATDHDLVDAMAHALSQGGTQ